MVCRRRDRREVRRLNALRRQAATGADEARCIIDALDDSVEPVPAAFNGCIPISVDTVFTITCDAGVQAENDVPRYPDGKPVEWFVLEAWSKMKTASAWLASSHISYAE